MRRLLVLCVVGGALATASAIAQTPTLLFSDLANGPSTGGESNNGAYVCVWGRNFGATRGTSTITVGGVEVAAYKFWGDATTTNAGVPPAKACFQLGASVPAGSQSVVMTTAGGVSNALPFVVRSTGAVYYVATTGSNAAAGTFAAPWRDPTYCIASKAPGDVCVIRGGDYNETNTTGGGPVYMTTGQGGPSASAHSVITGYPGEEVRLTASAGGYTVSVDDGSHWTIANMTALGPVVGMLLRNGLSDLRVVGMRITCPGMGYGSLGCMSITRDTSNSKFYGNEVYEAGKMVGAYAISTASGPYTIPAAPNNVIRFSVDDLGTQNITLTPGSNTNQQVVDAINAQASHVTASTYGGGVLVTSTGPQEGLAYGGYDHIAFEASNQANQAVGLPYYPGYTQYTGGGQKMNHAAYIGTESHDDEFAWSWIHDSYVCRGLQIHSSPDSGYIGLPSYNLSIHDNWINKTGCSSMSMGSVDPDHAGGTGILIYNNVFQNGGTYAFNNQGGPGALTCIEGPSGAEYNANSRYAGWDGAGSPPGGVAYLTVPNNAGSGNITVTGTATHFLTELKPGWYIEDYPSHVGGYLDQYEILSVDSDTQLTVTPLGSVSGTGFSNNTYIQVGTGSIKIYNNTAYNCGIPISHDPYGVTGAVARHNRVGHLLLMEMTDNIIVAGTGGVDGPAPYLTLATSSTAHAQDLMRSSHNLWFGAGAAPTFPVGGEPGQVNADPAFAGAPGDLRLQAGSPAIDAGISTGISTDVVGVSRPPSYSIGAYEYDSGYTPPAVTGHGRLIRGPVRLRGPVR